MLPRGKLYHTEVGPRHCTLVPRDSFLPRDKTVHPVIAVNSIFVTNGVPYIRLAPGDEINIFFTA